MHISVAFSTTKCCKAIIVNRCSFHVANSCYSTRNFECTSSVISNNQGNIYCGWLLPLNAKPKQLWSLLQIHQQCYHVLHSQRSPPLSTSNRLIKPYFSCPCFIVYSQQFFSLAALVLEIRVRSWFCYYKWDRFYESYTETGCVLSSLSFSCTCDLGDHDL